MTEQKIILIADDESDIRSFLREVLEQCGFHVFEAPDGMAALGILKARPVDLLLTDHRMPGLTGTELIKALNVHNIDVPRIMMSGFCDLDPADLQKLDVVAFVSKPFQVANILDLCKGVLSETAPRTRRKFERFGTPLRQIRVRRTDSLESPHDEEFIVQNVSFKGMQVSSLGDRRDFAVGESLNFKISIPREGASLEIGGQATVCWTKNSVDANGPHTDFGVEFVDIKEGQILNLIKALQELKSPSSSRG